MTDHLLWCRNRRILSVRCSWPADAVEMCERLEREHPGWLVSWMRANDIPGWELPAGYCATRDDVSLPRGDEMRRLPEDGVWRRPAVFGPTVGVLRERIASMQARIEEREAAAERFWRRMHTGLI